MSDTYTIRTTAPKTEGGSLDDVQLSYRVEALDPDGNVLYADHLWASSKGLGNDPRLTAEHVTESAARWALDNAERIQAGEAKRDEKAAERAAVQPLLDAIQDAPDVLVRKADLEAAVAGRAVAEAAPGEIVTDTRLIVQP